MESRIFADQMAIFPVPLKSRSKLNFSEVVLNTSNGQSSSSIFSPSSPSGVCSSARSGHFSVRWNWEIFWPISIFQMLVASIQFLYLFTAFLKFIFPFSFFYFACDELPPFFPADEVSSSAGDVLSLFNILNPASCLARFLVWGTAHCLNLDTLQMPVSGMKYALIPSRLCSRNWDSFVMLNSCIVHTTLSCNMCLYCDVRNVLYKSSSVDEISYSFIVFRMQLAELCLAFFLEWPLLKTAVWPANTGYLNTLFVMPLHHGSLHGMMWYCVLLLISFIKWTWTHPLKYTCVWLRNLFLKTSVECSVELMHQLVYMMMVNECCTDIISWLNLRFLQLWLWRIFIILDVMPCSPIKVSEYFVRTYHICHQGWRVNRRQNSSGYTY